MSTDIIAEIGINHNGSEEICKDLISLASVAGCNYVKIQKRTPDLCVPDSQKDKVRSTPWGDMTYLDYKKKIEFDEEQIYSIKCHCINTKVEFFASVWDIPSSEMMSKYSRVAKIPSALITDLELCRHARDHFSNLIISTGMSTEEEIEKCVRTCNPDVIMHTNSTYPCPVDQVNLNYIKWLKKRWPTKEIGYSGHEYGLVSTFAAVALGVEWVERHITLNHNMWGSDHSSSLEPSGLFKLVKGIRDIEQGFIQPVAQREVMEGEKAKRKSLRK